MAGTLPGAVQRAHVPGVVLGLAGTAAVLGAIAGLDDPAVLPVLVVALALGAAFALMDYGFTAGFRAFLEDGDGGVLGAAFVVPAVAALVVLPVGALAEGYQRYVAPVGPSLVVGAMIFGVGMMARLIQIGTPNGGSPDAFRVLVDGRDFGAPIVPSYSPAILGTLPSLYQLLPRATARPVFLAGSPEVALDLHDPEVWQRMGWGIAKPAIDADLATLMPDVGEPAERRRFALGLQARPLRRGRAFAAAMDRPVTAPPGTELMIVAGDAMPTTERMSANPANGAAMPLTTARGDGLVLRDSALLDSRQGQDPDRRAPLVRSPMDFRRALFLPREHLEWISAAPCSCRASISRSRAIPPSATTSCSGCWRSRGSARHDAERRHEFVFRQGLRRSRRLVSDQARR
jgi:hypothetical protein